MATIYPSGIDGFAQLPLVVDLVSPVRADDVNRLRDAVVAVETELGVVPSGTFGTVKDRLDFLEALTGDGYVDADRVLIADLDGYYVGLTVEAALTELGSALANLKAAEVAVVDADGYFVSNEVEGALAELGAAIANLTAAEVSVVDGDGYFTSSDVEGVLAELGATTEILNSVDVSLDFISGHIETVQDKTYYLLINAPYAGTITSVTTRSDSGTATGTVQINGTPLGGSANAISSTEVTEPHSTSNTFSAGDDITLVISSNLSALEVRFTIRFVRTS